MSTHFERAAVLLDQRRYDFAEQQLRDGLAESPHDVWAHSSIAVCRARRGDMPGAHRFARRAIELAPDHPEGYLRLAWTILHDPDFVAPSQTPWWRLELSRRERRLNEAERLLHQVLRLSPQDPHGHRLLALTLLDLGRFPQALAAAERGLAYDPACVGLNDVRSSILAAMGRNREASDSARDTLRVAPESARTHAVRGLALLADGRATDAVVHLSESLRLNPADHECRRALVEAMQTQAWPFRLAFKLHAPYSGRIGWKALYAFFWASTWIKGMAILAAAWDPPEPIGVWLVGFGAAMGIGLPALLFSLRRLALFLISLHPQARRLLTFPDRAAAQLIVYAAAAAVCFVIAQRSGFPPSGLTISIALTTLPLMLAGAADGSLQSRKRLFTYAACFGATAVLVGATASGFSGSFQVAFLVAGLAAVVPPAHLVWRTISQGT